MTTATKLLRYHARWKPLLAGVFWAGVTVGASIFILTPQQSLELHALVLVLAASVYLGAALSGNTARELRQERLQAAVFYAFTLAGLWINPIWLALGYVLHVGWDLLHHPEHVRTRIAGWVPPLCLTYDLLVAAYIFLALA